MNVLVWHVHGSYTTALVQGPHRYLLPVLPDRGPDGRGRARTWDWPASAVELAPDELASTEVDVVVLQRPQDEALANAWLGGRRVGRDVPAVWLEHNAPQGRIAELRHPAADRDDLTVVHVTHDQRPLLGHRPHPHPGRSSTACSTPVTGTQASWPGRRWR